MSASPHHEHKRHAPRRLRFAILTISDTRGPDDDASGDALAALVGEAGHEVVARSHARDEPDQILAAAESALASEGVDVVVTTGGTGIAPRDVTLETLRPLLDKELPGFGELFRSLSFAQIGSAAMASRATAGAARGRLLVILPGSPNACRLAMEKLVLPEAPHLVGLLRRSA